MLGAGKVVKGAVDANHIHAETKQMPLRADYINQFLGICLPTQEMCDILESLDFDVDDDLMITVPTFRADIECDADIAEEIARFYGYDKIPTTLLYGLTTQGIWSEEQKAEKRVHFTLLSQGLNEVITSSFVSPKGFDKIRLPQESSFRTCVKISNPLGEDTSLMRTSMIPSIMDIFSRNYNFRNSSCGIYEIGTVYLPNSDSSKLPDEKKIIALGFYNSGDYYRLKGICEELFKSFGIQDYTVEPQENDPSFHPGRCAAISVNERNLATVGQIHPGVCLNYDIDKEVYAAFIDFTLLLQLACFEKTYTPLPKFPSVLRDLALVCDISLPVAKIESCIKEQAGKLLEKLTLFDVYTGNQIGENKKSVAYSLILRDNHKTLNDREIEEVLSRVLNALKNALDVSLRK
ncbi:Phenylalanine--tRNA ligase beta subunit [bioreactor metagenome]|uniref:phenylalanine--tRNA ligase n=1 Tax=bioreactor metagenome TaxID=1076179 RepID=A0A645CY93_9ZZZZ